MHALPICTKTGRTCLLNYVSIKKHFCYTCKQRRLWEGGFLMWQVAAHPGKAPST